MPGTAFPLRHWTLSANNGEYYLSAPGSLKAAESRLPTSRGRSGESLVNGM